MASSSLPLSLYSPADVLVLVGGQLFRAHRCILATNSGYFKSLLDADVGQASLSLPGLPSRAFSVLLDFMYSGHLATNGANIYEVLLCAQFLHMPRAIDLCKAYLLHQQQQQELPVGPATSTTPTPLQWLTLSPLAYKGWLADSIYTRCLDSVSLLRPPNILRPIPTKHAVAPLLSAFQKEGEHLSGSFSLPCPPAPCSDRITVTQVDVRKKINSDAPSFTWTRPDFRPPGPTTPENPEVVKQGSIKESNAEDKLPQTDEKTTHQVLDLANATITATSNVIIDIACCDGPVQFQRVINENYGLVCTAEPAATGSHMCNDQHLELRKCSQNDANATTSTSSLTSNFSQPCLGNDINDNSIEKCSFNRRSPLPQPSSTEPQEERANDPTLTPARAPTPTCCHGHSSSEGSGWTDSDNDTKEHVSSDTSATNEAAKGTKHGSTNMQSALSYHCVYCNHTFKSRYCYQKHKQRHINPKAFTGSVTKPKQKETTAPLDMNVPFYPCKICGSKFPSYYFVHKHRKLYHCDERLWTDESTQGSNNPAEKD